MNRIATIVGARPQFIKSLLISNMLRENGFKEVYIHTGQHYDISMSNIFFQELELPKPDYSLGIGSGTHAEQTGKMLTKIERVLLSEKIDLVIVYGDTNTTLAGALAAAKLVIPIAHVEAGLRSYNRKMPEEVNRVLTDHISDLLFVPTNKGMENLLNEGIDNDVFQVGDVMYDIFLYMNKIEDSRVERLLEKYKLEKNNFCLVTIHRAQNTDDVTKLSNIMNSLIVIAEEGKTVFFPLHPRTKKRLKQYNILKERIPENLILTDPVSYIDMIILESNARLVITDSGGVQKESYFFKKPAIIIREETEWTELIEAGWNILTGTDTNMICSTVGNIWNDTIEKKWDSFYGDGKASYKIVEKISEFLK